VGRKTRHLEDALLHLRTVQHELLQADKMASIGTLAGGIAHEFNNLIGGIRGCIADALEDETAAHRREPLEVALRATARATAVTDKLLRFARPRVEGPKAVSLRALVAEVVDLVEPQARHQGVALQTDVDEQLTAVVDANEMHQVFLNLLTNALQAMPEGGRLVIDGARDGDVAKVRVADTGVGIEPGEIDHVFDPFYSKSRDHHGAHRGTGLGLSVSYRIVEAHGGVLSVESASGRGSTFTVALPVEGPPGAQHE
jgi:two-component system NtrC family sensor kinase